MSGPLRIAVAAGQRLYVNGAVLRVDRKVGIEFLNDVTFLLDSHVLQPEAVTSPLRQLYFVIQSTMIEPDRRAAAAALYRDMLGRMRAAYANPAIRDGLDGADRRFAAGRPFDALRILKGLFAVEDAILAAAPQQETEPWT